MKYLDVAKKATITLTKMGGGGVLVKGNLILTAAHCITHSHEGSMALGDYFIENIQTAQGELKVAPLAVEPVSDIAVLGELDNQEFGEEVERFEMFCEKTRPVPLCLTNYELRQPFTVYILNSNGEWVKGSAKVFNADAPRIWVQAEKQIDGGASGGPIVNQSGELVGIVSVFSNQTTGPYGKSSGPAPRPHLALPAWVCRRILGKVTAVLDPSKVRNEAG